MDPGSTPLARETCARERCAGIHIFKGPARVRDLCRVSFGRIFVGWEAKACTHWNERGDRSKTVGMGKPRREHENCREILKETHGGSDLHRMVIHPILPSCLYLSRGVPACRF